MLLELNGEGPSWSIDCRVEGCSLLVQPGLGGRGVVHKFLILEPQADLSLGIVQGVAAVDDVPEETEHYIFE